MGTDEEKSVLTICMGSACHQMGVYEVLDQIKKKVASHHLQDVIEIKGAFCLGECGQGVIMQFRGRTIRRVNAENAAEVFEKEIFSRLPQGVNNHD